VALLDCARRGGIAWWIAPTYGMADAVWRAFKTTLEGIWTDKSEQARRIVLPGDGVIRVRSGHDPDALRGAGLDLAVLDEAAFMPAEIWTGAVRPALSDRQGRGLFLSTPNGLNWFHRLYQLGRDPLQPDWASFHQPTISSPLIPQAEVDAARLDMPDRWFRQEYEAAFIEDAGQVFRHIDTTCTARPESGPRPGARYACGIDWGRVDDYTAFAVFDVDRRQLVALDRFRQVNWAQQRDRLRALYDRWRPGVIWAEANSIGSVNIEALQSAGLPVRAFQTTAQSKGPLIEALALAMERQTITLLDDPVLRGELLAYTMTRLPSGAYRYEAAAGSHDDTVIAVALAWMGVKQGGSPVSFA
jgi:phage FluMu gp28-like protein